MNGTNLVPLARQLRQARQTRTRAWAFAAGGILLACVATYAACAVGMADHGAPASSEFASAARELSQYNGQATHLRTQLSRVQREVYAARSLADQPDMSLLFAMVSRTAGEQIVLSHCEMTESTGKGAEEDAAGVGGAVLRLDGFGKTQAAVAGFVLQLETAGLFNRVTLLQSHSQPLFGNDAAAFRIECLMQPNPGGQR